MVLGVHLARGRQRRLRIDICLFNWISRSFFTACAPVPAIVFQVGIKVIGLVAQILQLRLQHHLFLLVAVERFVGLRQLHLQ